MSENRDARLSVGEFELNLQAGKLFHNGQPVKIEPQPLKVLQFLMERPGQIVSREDLRSHIWTAATFVQFDQGLNYCIREIRRAFGDRAINPKYVETLPKLGYRLIAPVSPAHEPGAMAEIPASAQVAPVVNPVESPAAVVSEAAPDEPLSRVPRRNLLWGAGVAVLSGAAWLLRNRTKPESDRVMRVTVELPDHSTAADPGQLLGGPALSPDGACLVVALNTTDGVALFRRLLNSNSIVEIEGTAGASFPFWSPDSHSVGYFADGQLKRVSINGGSAVSLCPALSPRGGAWGKGGVILFSAAASASYFQEIYAVAESGGTVRNITRLNRSGGENSHRYPHSLNSEDQFLYFVRADDPAVRGVYLGSLRHAGQKIRLTVADGPFAVGADPKEDRDYLISQRAGKMVAQRFDRDRQQLSGPVQMLLDGGATLSVSNTGALAARINHPEATKLVWRDEGGRKLADFGDNSDYWCIDISPDDASVAAIRHNSADGEFTVWAASASRGVFERVSDWAHVSSLCWSRDSRALYYSSNRDGTVRRCPIGGKGAEESVAELDPGAQIEDVSPGGRYFVTQIVKDSSDAEVAWGELKPGVRGPVSLRRLGSFGNWRMHPSLSPDGQWLAFASGESGRSEIYLSSFPSCNSKMRLSTNGGHSPQWQGDGKAVFFIGSGGKLMAARRPAAGWGESSEPVGLFSLSGASTVFGPTYDHQTSLRRFLLIESEPGAVGNRVELILNWHSLLNPTG